MSSGKRISYFSTPVIVAILIFSLQQVAFASTSVSYNFNTAGDLTSKFDSYIKAGSATISQSASGGINNTGAINAQSTSGTYAYGVFAPTERYSIGATGSNYTFTSFIKSEGGNGYSGMGFSADPSVRVDGPPYRPGDALGVSVHGSGYIFHNGATNYTGWWNPDNVWITDRVTNNAAITTVKAFTGNNNAIPGNATLSPSGWFKLVFKVEKASSTTFDMRLEIWPADATGTLLNPSGAAAIFAVNGIQNSTIMNSPAIRSYINFSGHRVTYFDNYDVSLSGGSSVIAQGAPVVLTNSAAAANSDVTFNGSVTSDGGAAVTERGFVYSTSPSPTVNNSKVVVGSGTGSFTGSAASLPNGTYYLRSYAINATGVSYGSEETVTISVAQSTPSASPSSTPSTTPAANPSPTVVNTSVQTPTLAETGSSSIPLAITAVFLVALGATLVLTRRAKN